MRWEFLTYVEATPRPPSSRINPGPFSLSNNIYILRFQNSRLILVSGRPRSDTRPGSWKEFHSLQLSRANQITPKLGFVKASSTNRTIIYGELFSSGDFFFSPTLYSDSLLCTLLSTLTYFGNFGFYKIGIAGELYSIGPDSPV